MNIYLVFIFIFFYYRGNDCLEKSAQIVMHERHSKVRLLPSSSDERSTYRPFSLFWKSDDAHSVVTNSKLRHDKVIKPIGQKNMKRRRRKLIKKKNKSSQSSTGTNLAEIIGYLNENTATYTKVLNPELREHLNTLGQSKINSYRKYENLLRKTRDEELMLNLKVLHVNVHNFGCDVNNGGCAHFCNESSPVRCTCLEGFKLSINNKSCLDINECKYNNGGCSHGCVNNPGSRYCTCPRGFRLGDNLKSCRDIDECLLRNGHGPCQDTCMNTVGSYQCGCSLTGTRLGLNKHTCEDINECLEGVSGCSHGCINIIGGVVCTCPYGMALKDDLKICEDIYEQNDQVEAPGQAMCPLLPPPKHGHFHCFRKKADVLCELVCPRGYKTLGDYRVICDVKGAWNGNKTGQCLPLSGRNFDLRNNYINFEWKFPKPKITCSPPLLVYIKTGEELIRVHFPPPKTNVNWRNVQSDPPEAKKTLEVDLPQGFNWVVFTATNPQTKRIAKCIISIIVRRERSNFALLDLQNNV